MKIGAYPIEQDYSHYVAYIAKTIFAVVGTATKGPIGEAVLCRSPQDLVNKFGVLKPGFHALYAGQYFLSQSTRLYFVRAASDKAKESSVALEGTSTGGTSVADAITFRVLEKGTYADGYTIQVDAGTPKVEQDATTLTYNLTVKSKLGTILHVVRNIEIDELTTDYNDGFLAVSAVNDAAVSLKTSTTDNPVVYTFAGGNDGTEDIEPGDYSQAAKDTLRSERVDMNLFAIPGVSDKEVIVDMLALAEAKGDCLYLVDPPEGLDKAGVMQWHNGEGVYDTRLDSSYGALYYDWTTIYDSVNKVKVNVPPSVCVAATYAYSDRNSEVWYAPAGLNRGIVRGVLNTATKLSKEDVEDLYSTTSDSEGSSNCINSIYEDPQAGLVLWGQKTLSRSNTALNRVNVRRLMNYLKRVIVAACNALTFEPNDRITWNSFEMKVDPILKNVMNKRGVYEYRIIKGETIVSEEDIDNYRMPGMIIIKPTKAAEEIPIYFTLTSTGADFNSVLEESGITVQ